MAASCVKANRPTDNVNRTDEIFELDRRQNSMTQTMDKKANFAKNFPPLRGDDLHSIDHRRIYIEKNKKCSMQMTLARAGKQKKDRASVKR